MGRVTQSDIARLAGTSQTAVSLVLNGRAEGRVAPPMIERISDLLRSAGYLRGRARQIDATRVIGVFTYEPVFPSVAADFYHPFLVGLERAAEASSHDLLLLTSAAVGPGSRRVFNDRRLDWIDGCILLGREVVAADLARLNAAGFPYVSVGRRDDAGGPVPYVGADYTTATRDLIAEAIRLGHRRFVYVSYGSASESARDRYRGFRSAVDTATRDAGLGGITEGRLDHPGIAEVLTMVRDLRATCVVIEDATDGEAIARAAMRAGHVLGEDLSLVLLHEPQRHLVGTDLTRLSIPRADMASEAFTLLLQITGAEPVAGDGAPQLQRLLPVDRVLGRTLGSAPAS